MAGTSAGLLEDYASVAAGLLVLYGVTGEDRWVPVAAALLDTVLTSFGDGSGGFYDTAADGERLIFRPADPIDNATPSGAFAAADALVSYGALSGRAARGRRGRRAARAAADRRPLPAPGGRPLGRRGAAVRPRRDRHRGSDDDPRTLDLLRTALHAAPPGAVFALGPGTDGAGVPLLAGRGLVLGGPDGVRMSPVPFAGPGVTRLRSG